MLTIDDSSNDIPIIQYSRSDGIAEKALIHACVHTYDGPSSWRQKQENKSVSLLSQAEPEDAAAALFAALKTEMGQHILNQGINHFLTSKQNNPRSKGLVVCSSIEEAKKHKSALKKYNVTAEIATSEDSKHAEDVIRDFRHSDWCDVLVTVAMAYEGMDVPQIDHIILLTRIRSTTWLTQCLARATRFDKEGRDWEDQVAHIFCPDDQVLQRALKEMGMDQVVIIPESEEPSERSGSKHTSSGEVIPLNSAVASWRSLDLDSQKELEAMRIEEALTDAGIPVTAEQIERLQEKVDVPKILSLPITPAIQQRALRKRIEEMVRECARHQDIEPKALNKAIKEKFGKSRADMTNEELDAVITWLERWREHHMY